MNASGCGGVLLGEWFVQQFGFDDFEQLVRENQRVVYHIALSVLGNAADAEDITQDAFARAYVKIATLREPEKFRAWVCQVSRRLALNRMRSDTRARKRDELASRDAEAVVDVEALVEDRDFDARVRSAIDRLAPKLREVLILCAIEGFEPSDVARLLGIPQGTVRSRLHLARKQLLGVLSA